jgi:putative ABC transport system ATP-binding protein
MLPARISEITLQHIMPQTLEGREIDNSGIWKKELVLEKGKHYHIQAPSGSGKTTLANILYGLRNDYTGHLLFDGKKSKNLSIKKWSEIRQNSLSIVFQDLRLLGQFTAWENILLNREQTGMVEPFEIKAWAEKFGIKPFLDKKCKRLSQGEKQRIAILRALSQPFEWLILDEPFSHLDSTNVTNISALIKERLENYNAGLIMLQLAPDTWFNYDKSIKL